MSNDVERRMELFHDLPGRTEETHENAHSNLPLPLLKFERDTIDYKPEALHHLNQLAGVIRGVVGNRYGWTHDSHYRIK
jgi:hypothetical protein